MINKCRAAIPLLGDDKANFLPLPHKDMGHYVHQFIQQIAPIISQLDFLATRPFS